MDLAAHIRNIPDFPKPGVQFKDITTLLLNSQAFQHVINTWKDRYADKGVTAIVGGEARGFVFGAPLAYAMGLPFVLIRKKGKLPGDTFSVQFDLEYGTETFQIHTDALNPNDRAVLVDDLLATGGTMAGMAELVKRLGAEVVEIAFVIELTFLHGRDKLGGLPVHSLVQYNGE